MSLNSGHPAGDRPALLILDMINELEGAAGILDQAEAASPVIRDLRATARRCGAPVIYVDGDYDQWSEDRRWSRESVAPGRGSLYLSTSGPVLFREVASVL